ncbi:Flavodoxin [Halanaerobium saccharolyticum subsp. saccharolyticum DSM 6643]|uniref:Flavodoxin n=1 Tax=Halanaerobium saccharolyticum subsp. saccharolyticum DSM 6643 TaxID=1293054 RepID=M5DYP8_9FIRM|nr:flavodoxin family protein [Halanaerobium saccharolyticum]CCU78101.1 Flavodoxin [Halanaerobium saccharolyticum subsp. saccharolyticum DSM 6643]
MNISILYHSESGNTESVAEIIEKGCLKVKEVKTKVMSIEEVDIEFVNSSQAIILGSPTYTGDISWQMKSFLDRNKKINYKDKLGAVFATENFIGGGADSALLTLISHLLVKGMIVYSAGASEGKPYTHFGAVCIQAGNKNQKERAEIFGERISKKTVELFS